MSATFRLALGLFPLLATACGHEAPPAASLGEPASQKELRWEASSTLSPWYGQPAYAPEAPEILSDQRLSWVGPSPNRLQWELPPSEAGRELRTAVRLDAAQWRHAMEARVFWEGPSGELETLAKVPLGLPLATEGKRSPPWHEIEVALPATRGRLTLSVHAEDPAFSAAPGPFCAWAAPQLSPQVAVAARRMPDVVVITIDTLRFDGLEDMPYLRGLMAQGWQWQEAFAPSNWTLPALASLFTGLPAREHGCGRGPFAAAASGAAEDRAFRALGGPPTVASFLHEQGYATAMWHQNPFLESWSGLDQGFERYVRTADRPQAGHASLLAWWRAQTRPRFLVLHEFTPHLPYAPDWEALPDPLAELPITTWFGADLAPEVRRQRFALSEPEREVVRQRYRHQLAELDAALATLVPQLLADAPDCLILIHADHGEDLWDDGAFEHGFSFDDSVLHVPLAVVWPGELAPASASGPVPAAQGLTAALSLMHARRDLPLGPFAPTSLIADEQPVGGKLAFESVLPLYRSEEGGRRWSPEQGWTSLPFRGECSPGVSSVMPAATAQQLAALGYLGSGD